MPTIDKNAYEKPEAKPMVYKGIHFRAKTEGKTAQAMDNFGITWQYEPRNYQLKNGIWYKPDFWLPYARMFVECKGEQTDIAMAKAHGLVSYTECPVLIMGYDWAKLFKYHFDIKPSEMCGDMEAEPEIVCYSDCLYLAKCKYCGKYWFVSCEDTYTCPCCKRYDGGSIFAELHEIDGITSLFDLGQKRASKEYAKYCD